MKLRKSLYNFLAFSILTAPLAVSAQWDPGSVNNEANLPEGTLTQIIINIMRWLLIIVGFIGVIGFVIAGILYLTAAGDDSQMERAKNSMVWSIIGVIVALMGYVIIQAANTMLSGGGNVRF